VVKLGGFVGGTAASILVGMATSRFGLMTSFIAGTIAGGFGLYYGAKIARKYAP
jgi:hypothetical protein